MPLPFRSGTLIVLPYEIGSPFQPCPGDRYVLHGSNEQVPEQEPREIDAQVPSESRVGIEMGHQMPPVLLSLVTLP